MPVLETLYHGSKAPVPLHCSPHRLRLSGGRQTRLRGPQRRRDQAFECSALRQSAWTMLQGAVGQVQSGSAGIESLLASLHPAAYLAYMLAAGIGLPVRLFKY